MSGLDISFGAYNDYGKKNHRRAKGWYKTPFSGFPYFPLKTLQTHFTVSQSAATTSQAYTQDRMPCEILPCSFAWIQALNLVKQSGVAEDTSAIATAYRPSNFATRDGNRIILKSVNLQFVTFTPMVAPYEVKQVASNYFRMMVVYDKATNGSYLAAHGATSAITANFNQDGVVATNDFLAPTGDLNPLFFERMKIIWSEDFQLPAVDTAATPTSAHGIWGSTVHSNFIIDKYIRLPNLETVFNNQGPLNTSPDTSVYRQRIGSINTGGLYLVGISHYSRDHATNRNAWALKGMVETHFAEV